MPNTPTDMRSMPVVAMLSLTIASLLERLNKITPDINNTIAKHIIVAIFIAILPYIRKTPK